MEIKKLAEAIIFNLKENDIKHCIINLEDYDIIIQPVKKAEIHEIPGK